MSKYKEIILLGTKELSISKRFTLRIKVDTISMEEERKPLKNVAMQWSV